MTQCNDSSMPSHAVVWEDEDGKWSIFGLYDNEEEAQALAFFWTCHAEASRIVRHIVMRLEPVEMRIPALPGTQKP